MIIGLTGGIGTGKSTVSNIFRQKGIPVVDTDVIAREVIDYPEVVNEIIRNFGTEILEEETQQEQGQNKFKKKKISRNKLGQIVFKDEKKVGILNSIMHPLIIKVMKEQTEKLKKDNKIIVADVPLLFEIHLEKEFDITVLVYADKETQIKRIMKRDKRTLEQAEDIINSQMDIEEKKKKSNYIIYNNGDFEKLTEETEKFLKSLKNM
ncbi:dephospho-CoA kinase [Pseudoleptotrichia goodfellowii]|jgi:dephospho-coA kinase|uniref:Dephospho-CoA kinase n=1 Tax=Pseudoleptotrichia goodfellowii F0264 TaxID=596323 RepID=D0GP90_9FUSO|nr:dephospho-CoA kinase [Pseudoleptotrichia goodfellowii]EEY34095.1 dephospho-CoA kinase [Pseudoleptotrichia goodfellowii F0264]MBF4805231.1 dephospho-CoA kinase [Pseudoleptotrichia goodfellowii]